MYRRLNTQYSQQLTSGASNWKVLGQNYISYLLIFAATSFDSETEASFPDLNNITGEPSIEPDPVARGNHTDTGHAAEDGHP